MPPYDLTGQETEEWCPSISVPTGWATVAAMDTEVAFAPEKGVLRRAASRPKTEAIPSLSLSLGSVLGEYQTLFGALKPNFGYDSSPVNCLGIDFRAFALARFRG